ncbi:E3 ubiquitin-protein ligase RBBP6 [Agrilus planipennis]|uniref:E3 ubiquitin-protein ligase RBBP6 n=1 Tax=Agrilus planipennis TaxID=224129 RepID=A0A7F5R7F2_AGRPL|nr:E3 ubiquitin-protein ligase RBBP6 [Agrilus planipennis]
MSVHYKFKSALEYDTVTFDGLHISVRDLKNAIMQQKRIGKGTDFDLQVTNAQTKEVYEDNDALIPKNTSLLIARIPSSQVKVKTWEGYGGSASPDTKIDDIGPIAKTADLSKLDASEEDKIRAMMSQSTQDYDPSNYLKIRGSNQVGAVPLNYRCFKCHQGGHWIKDCPLSQGAEPMEIKKSTGIPRSFMVPVEGPQVPGAMMTPNGSFAVPVLDHQAYNEKPQPPAHPEEKQPEIPEDLVCSICSDLLTDAVMIPCCGNSFCDECIRSILLESEDHECPDCHDRDISPTTLIPNRFLRNAVANFKNTTGYVKRPVYRPPPTIVEPPEPKKDEEPAKVPTSTTPTPIKESTPPPVVPQPETEKLVISEADSTETPKTIVKDTAPEDKVSSQQINIPEGPPGVSPKKDESPRAQPITTMANVPRIVGHPRHKSSHDRSPRRHHPHQKSPSYKETINHMEDRPGTPTVDEPGGIENMAPSTNGKSVYQAGMQPYGTPLAGVMPPVGVHPPVVGSYRPPMAGYQGPPPNFRMPPPMSNPPPYLPSPYTVPPRPVYDGDRAAPYSNYSATYRPSRGRDYPPREPLRRGRTPPGVIDDPLAAFERMLKEKDERERRAKQRKTRSYSRSSSRSYSRSPVHRRGRSRSPRRRMSRSRSRSFSISRSRSRSFSPSPRGSPPRDYSPRGSPRHKGPPRYRSPIKSPPRGPLPPELYRGGFKRTDRDRDLDRDRDYHHPPPPHHHRDRRGYSKDRDKDYGTGGRDMRGRGIGGPPPLSSSAGDYGHAPYYDTYDRGGGGGGRKQNQGPPPSVSAPSSAQWNQSSMIGLGPPRKEYPSSSHPYYASDVGPMHRYHSRDDNPPHHLPPLMQPPPTQQPPSSHLPHIRQYDDIAPPGVEQPPIPGLESTPKYEERYSTPYETDRPVEKYDNYDRVREEKVRDERKRDDRGNYRDERVKERDERTKERDEKVKEREEKIKEEKLKDEKVKDEEYSEVRGVRRSRHSRTPEKSHDSNSKSSKPRSPEKYKRRKWDESSEGREKRSTHEKDKSRRRDTSDDKKSRDKKKRKEKKESEKKKRKDKKERKEHDKEKTRKMEEHDSEQEKVSKEDYPEPKDKEPQRSKEIDEKVLPETELVENREESPETTVSNESGKQKSKETSEIKEEKMKSDLYGDLLSEDVDNTVIQTYGKLAKNDDDEQQSPIKPKIVSPEKEEVIIPSIEQKEIFIEEPKDLDDSERDILEIHTNESDLKPDLELKNEVLAPIPEKSKWEVEEDSVVIFSESSNIDTKAEKSDKSAKVTNEVLKRAENAIFAKAINAIRPIEIKKISLDRAKLYSGERDGKERKVEEYKDTDGRNIQVTIPVNYESDIHPPSTETKPVITSKPRLSVKERLGVKVDDLDNIIQVERNRSRSLSPFSRRANYADRNLGHGERRVQLDERRRRGESSREHQRSSRYDRKDPRRDRNYHRTERSSKRDRDISRDRSGHVRRDRKDSRTPSKKISHERAKSKHKRESSSSSSTSDKKTTEKKKKDKKKEKKREKSKKHHKEEDSKDNVNTGEKEKKEEIKETTKTSAERRKSMIDEAHFEPDYDLETESEKEEKPKEETKKRSNSKTPDSLASKKRKLDKRRDSSSDSSSSSSSEEEKKRKKHKKRKKKKTKKESSSSSSSESESESSADEKDRKKKKHKKKQKKKKKSKK